MLNYIETCKKYFRSELQKYDIKYALRGTLSFESICDSIDKGEITVLNIDSRVRLHINRIILVKNRKKGSCDYEERIAKDFSDIMLMSIGYCCLLSNLYAISEDIKSKYDTDYKLASGVGKDSYVILYKNNLFLIRVYADRCVIRCFRPTNELKKDYNYIISIYPDGDFEINFCCSNKDCKHYAENEKISKYICECPYENITDCSLICTSDILHPNEVIDIVLCFLSSISKGHPYKNENNINFYSELTPHIMTGDIEITTPDYNIESKIYMDRDADLKLLFKQLYPTFIFKEKYKFKENYLIFP